jgi:predicted ribosome quality control (RQC) complex YloA/Tae2 family protein
MEEFILEAVVDDLRRRLGGATLGRVWQPSTTKLILDFRLEDGRLLFVSVDPVAPALFLTSRSHREFEDGSATQRSMASILRKRCSGASLVSLNKLDHDRVVTLSLESYDAGGTRQISSLVVELTGRSSNAYFVDADGRIASTLRPARAAVRRGPGDVYEPPESDVRPYFDSPEGRDLAEECSSATDFGRTVSGLGRTLVEELEARARIASLPASLASLSRDIERRGGPFYLYRSILAPARLTLSTFALESQRDATVVAYDDPSAAADAQFAQAAEVRAFEQVRRSLAARIGANLSRRERLAKALEVDAARAIGAERLRELGELLLAQLATAKPATNGFLVVDYYATLPGDVIAPAVEGDTPREAATKLFSRYQKAKRAAVQASDRLDAATREAATLSELLRDVQSAESNATLSRVERALDTLVGPPTSAKGSGRSTRDATRVAGARLFVSSDGYEILVGRTGASNDNLTFRVAKPSDLWLHAADYPGSHVIVRNPSRTALPHRTVVEAAQLAAFFSQAREERLVDVRYCERRFVAKPRGGAPGLVRLTRFKTVSVAPAPVAPVKEP